MRQILVYIFIAFPFLVFTQTFTKDAFIKSFNEADLRQKVILTSNLSNEQLEKVYPFIKDTLVTIKQRVYYKTVSNEAKFLFDIIDARVEVNNRQYHKSIFVLENGLRFHAQNLQDSLTVFRMLSPSYMKLRNYNKAFEIQEILERLKPRMPVEQRASFVTNKSYIYLQLGLYAESVLELRKEFMQKSKIQQKDTSVLGNYYNDMGVHFNRANILDSAVFYFNKAKTLVDAKGKYDKDKTYYDFFSGLIDGNIASALAKRKQFKEAIAPLKKDIYYSLKANNLLSASNSYNLIAECYLELKKYDLARKYIDSCKPLIAEIEELSPTLNNMLVEAKYYKYTGNLNKAAEFYDKYIHFKDSITKVDNESKLINQQVSFELYQKENLLIEKEKIIQNNQLIGEHQKTQRSYLLLGIVILFFVVLLLVINTQMNKRRQAELFIKNKHIVQQKTAIETALKEKEFLIKEIHHRVKNNLQIISSMLSLQAETIDNSEAKIVLQESRLRINSMALIHQLLYSKNNMLNVSISDYLHTLLSQIERSYSSASCKIIADLKCDNVNIDLDTAIPLGLIVNELVTNSYKHAFKKMDSGTITISFQKNETDNVYTLGVHDTGSGFDPKKIKSNSLGMELIQMLADQLDGKMVFTNDNGTLAEISFAA
ncbi:MAG TPA: histidine kinase dimerization/phosphoacceptor domain -containing protein [Bacteroidia bacterium]|nr:histidine kinase dimerization/phosphoacceptor domain -containing protein [Bacteroidia bacterium]